MPVLFGLIILFAYFFMGDSQEKTPYPSADVFSNTSSESQQYVAASGLSLRSAPDKGATRTNVLPSGTRILVKQTESPLVVDGQMGRWYHAFELNGYVAGHFIAPKMELGASPYILEKNSSGGELSNGLERLTLINGTVEYLAEHYFEGSGVPEVERSKGTYQILPNGIHITLEPSHKQYSMVPDDINLRYCEELGGFQISKCAPPNQRMKANRKICAWESSGVDTGKYYSTQMGWWCPPSSRK
jgi:hypothetical protein